MLRPEPLSDHAKRVADARLKTALDRWIRGRVPKADAPDMVQNVLAALLTLAHPPDTVDGLIAFGRRMLQHDLIDHYRHRETVRDVEVCALDDRHAETIAPAAPAEAWDGFDVAKRARLVNALVARGQLTDADVDVLERADAEGYPALAAELGTTDQALRVRAHRKRTLLRQGWTRYAAYGTGLAVLVLVAYSFWDRPENVSAPHPGPGPAHHEAAPSERAAALRASASKACAASQWKDCLDRLDEARALDPASDGDPTVRTLRDEARGALQPLPAPAGESPRTK
jgi:DNA-directed RNA polymerase specialized sigma24 family protein